MLDLPALHAWQAPPDVIWTRFPDSHDWVAHNPLSSCTHLITNAGHQLWTLAVAERHWRIDDLVARLAADTDQPEGSELRAVVEETLAFMDRAGLLRPSRR
jgi:hypothetical protein